MSGDRGTASIEMAVIGFAVLALTIPILSTVASIAEAHGEVASVAADAASWYARHGEPLASEDLGVDIVYEVDDELVVASATRSVSVIAAGGVRVALSASHTARARISPYRSGR